MSKEYDLYLEQHRANVAKGFYWIQENLPELLIDIPNVSYEHQICYSHDNSKDDSEEYKAYDAYFYGRNRSFQVVQDFQYAWLTHIHKNPHHWQHWILVHDDIENGKLETILEMPYNYIIEMICDWWAFSWARGDLYEIFNWYDEHSKNMKLAPETRTTVESILEKIKIRLVVLEEVKAEVTVKLYEKEMHNINTNVESISDIKIDILEVDANQVTDIELGGYVE